jgi:hypothetical protein
MQCVRQQEMLKTERCWKQVRAQDFRIPLPTRVNLASFILNIIFTSAHRRKINTPLALALGRIRLNSVVH